MSKTEYKPIAEMASVTLGADPELFFEKDGKIVGAEKVLGDAGIVAHSDCDFDKGVDRETKVVVDGVAGELNFPYGFTCRQVFARYIQYVFVKISGLEPVKAGQIRVSISPTVAIEQSELDSLKDENKKFGCAPSKNVYEGEYSPANKLAHVDAKTYPFRSAGGHLHIGNESKLSRTFKLLRDPDRLIPMLDIILGTICVLIDRDPGNKKRRETYGRAGEYRMPKYGIEYRTLSNFWLRSYPLMSFVTGLCRQVVSLALHDDIVKEFREAVDLADVAEAINENDFDKAMKIYKKIKPLLVKYTPTHMTLHKDNIEAFEYFVKRGVDKYFPETDLLSYWSGYNSSIGWEVFMNNVKNEMQEAKKKLLAKKATE